MSKMPSSLAAGYPSPLPSARDHRCKLLFAHFTCPSDEVGPELANLPRQPTCIQPDCSLDFNDEATTALCSLPMLTGPSDEVGPARSRYYPMAKNLIDIASRPDSIQTLTTASTTTTRPPPHTALYPCSHVQSMRRAHLFDGAVPS